MSPRKARPTKTDTEKRPSNKQNKQSGDPSDRHHAMQRINKVLAAAGLGSRRQVDELIEQGRVEIDGKVITQVGVKVDLSTASISVDGQLLKQHRPVYYALHKPEGVLCTNRDPQGRPRVIDFVPNQHRLFPVGRLDASSTGLILLTNDGELAQQLAHPKHEIPKRYAVIVVGQVEIDALKRLERGIYLAEGKAQVDQAKLKKVRKTSTELEITLSEGKNREIRRVLARLGHKVVSLKRIAIGPLKLADLPEGAYRPLSVHEVQGLYQAVDDIRRERKAARKARKKLAAAGDEPVLRSEATPKSKNGKPSNFKKTTGNAWEKLPSLAQNPYATEEDIDETSIESQQDEMILIRDHGPDSASEDLDQDEYFFMPKKRAGSVIGQEEDQDLLASDSQEFDSEEFEFDGNGFEEIDSDDKQILRPTRSSKSGRSRRGDQASRSQGKRSVGRNAGGAKPSGLKPSGPKSGRPKSAGPKPGGPKRGGPTKGGLKLGGPKRGGPKRGGPNKGGPKRGGPKRGGPNKGGRSARRP